MKYIHQGNRTLVPVSFWSTTPPVGVRPRQKSKHGLQSHIPERETLKEPELAEINLKENTFFMDPMCDTFLCV